MSFCVTSNCNVTDLIVDILNSNVNNELFIIDNAWSNSNSFNFGNIVQIYNNEFSSYLFNLNNCDFTNSHLTNDNDR